MSRKRYGVGVGARKDFDAEELVAFVRDVAARLEVDLRAVRLAALATHDRVEEFRRAAEFLGIELLLPSLADLQRRKRDVLTSSARIEASFGVGSLAEALALAAAGEGSQLLATRAATARLTCAVAICCSDVQSDL